LALFSAKIIENISITFLFKQSSGTVLVLIKDKYGSEGGKKI